MPEPKERLPAQQLMGDFAPKLAELMDVIINTAGLMPHSPLERLQINDWDRMIDVNIKSVLWWTRSCQGV